MDARTLEALKASIAKWERNAVAETPDNYLITPTDCPLCGLFFDEDCRGCPVAAKVRTPGCARTPYETAADTKFEWETEFDPLLPDTREVIKRRGIAHAAALKEVAFLQSLLPAEPTRPDPIIPGDIVGPSVEA